MTTTIEFKKDAYTIIMDKVLQSLEKGVIPWRVLWTKAGLPENLYTKTPYQGINVWLLASENFERNYFLSENQISKTHMLLKANAKPQFVIQLKGESYKNNRILSVRRKKETATLLHVYNISQCESINGTLANRTLIPENNFELCESIFKNMPLQPEVRHLEKDPYYHPLKDFINIPKIDDFPDKQSYYCALFHEMMHSTGHISRLGRKETLGATPFGSSHTLEELVVEMGTSYLMSMTGIKPNSVSVSDSEIDGWINKLYEDQRMIFIASMHAQKAIDFILNKRNSSAKNSSLSTIDYELVTK